MQQLDWGPLHWLSTTQSAASLSSYSLNDLDEGEDDYSLDVAAREQS